MWKRLFFLKKKRKQKSLMQEPRESLLISWMALNSSGEDILRQCECLHIRNLSASLFIFSKKAGRCQKLGRRLNPSPIIWLILCVVSDGNIQWKHHFRLSLYLRSYHPKSIFFNLHTYKLGTGKIFKPRRHPVSSQEEVLLPIAQTDTWGGKG